MSESKVRKEVEDLGIAAYLRMHGFKVVGRKGRVFYFSIQPQEENEFDKSIFEYASSPFHEFDAQLMSLKKLPRNFIMDETINDPV